MGKRGKSAQRGKILKLHRRILREALLPDLRRAFAVRRDRPRAPAHKAAAYSTSRLFASFERQLSALIRCGHIPEVRIAYRLRGVVEGGIFVACRPAAPLRWRAPTCMRQPHSPGSGEHHRLIVRHPVFDTLSASAHDFALHSGVVTVEKRQVVTGDKKSPGFPVSAPPPAARDRPLPRSDQGKNSESPCAYENGLSGFKLKGLFGCLNSLFVLAGALRAPARQ